MEGSERGTSIVITSRPVQIGRAIPRILDQARFSAIRVAGRQLGVFERWHDVGEPGQPAFQNGWSNYTGADANPLSYFLDTGKVVHWRGVIKALAPVLSHGSESQVCQLPAGWHSENAEFHAAIASVSVGGSPFLTTWVALQFFGGGVFVTSRDAAMNLASFNWLILDNHWYWK